MGHLDGRVAIITAGGGIGMGSAISKKFASEGAAVVLADLDGERADQVAREIREAGGKALPVKTDVTSATEVNRMVDAALSEFGSIGILVNHAGGSAIKRIEELSEEWWDYTLAVSLKGMYNCTRAVVPHMKKENWGRIVSTSSKGGFRLTNGTKGIAAYAAAKQAMVGFSRALAMELGPWNITLNCIAPGFVEHSGMKDLSTGTLFEPTPEQELMAAQKAGQTIVPLRYVTVEEAAEAFFYFVGPAGARVTGTTLHINGGSYFGT